MVAAVAVLGAVCVALCAIVGALGYWSAGLVRIVAQRPTGPEPERAAAIVDAVAKLLGYSPAPAPPEGPSEEPEEVGVTLPWETDEAMAEMSQAEHGGFYGGPSVNGNARRAQEAL